MIITADNSSIKFLSDTSDVQLYAKIKSLSMLIE
jgi:hypothetical protein